MKTRVTIIIFLLVILFACEDNSKVDYGLDKYYQEIVTVINENAFLLDDGTTVCEANGKSRKSLEIGKRAFLTFSYTDDKIPPFDRAIIVHGVSAITTGELKSIGKKDIDSFFSEPVGLESVWIGSHYLNMQFYIDFKSKPHSIALLTDSTQLQNDTIRIYFKHDSNGDPLGYPIHSFLSFDLEKVLGKPEKTKYLSVDIQSENANKTYEFNY